jgi:hypothetical protein
MDCWTREASTEWTDAWLHGSCIPYACYFDQNLQDPLNGFLEEVQPHFMMKSFTDNGETHSRKQMDTIVMNAQFFSYLTLSFHSGEEMHTDWKR